MGEGDEGGRNNRYRSYRVKGRKKEARRTNTSCGYIMSVHEYIGVFLCTHLSV